MLRATAWLLLAGLAACGGAEEPREVVHPDLSGLAAEEVENDSSNLNGRFLDPILRLGVVDGPEHLTFGNVGSIAPMPDGGILVLDDMNHVVRQFDRSGAFLGEFGRRGDGPLEFRDPVGLSTTPGGDIVVATRSGVKLFTLRGRTVAEGVRLVKEVTVPALPSPRSLCTLDNVAVTMGWRSSDDAIVHVVDLSTGGVRSFGEGYRTGSKLARQDYSEGKIACAEQHGIIIAALKSLPAVKGYSLSGEPLWAAKLPDFRAVQQVESRNEEGQWQIRDVENPGTMDQVLSAVMIGEDSVYILVGRYSAPAEGGEQSLQGLRAFALDVRSGEGGRTWSGLFFPLAWQDGLIYGSGPDSTMSVLQVVVGRLRSGERRVTPHN